MQIRIKCLFVFISYLLFVMAADLLFYDQWGSLVVILPAIML